MPRPREIELKLELNPLEIDRVRQFLADRLGPAVPVRQHLGSVYFDTGEHDLHAKGLTLRVRRVGERHVQTAKASDGAGAGLFDRSEWESDVVGDGPDLAALADTPLAKVLRRGGGEENLRAVFGTAIDRTTWQVERDGSRIEVALDSGEVVAGDAVRPIAELELELQGGSPAALFAFVRDLAAELPMRIAVRSKSEQGYDLLRGEGASSFKAAPIALRRGMTTAEAFRTVARACLRQFRLNEPHVTAGRSVEALHQARVGLRRLRSALSIFRDVVADDEFAVLKARLKELTAPLGEARNLDVYLARAARPEAAREPTLPGMAEYVTRLEAERDRAYERIAATLDSDAFRRLMLDLVAWTETGPWGTCADPDASVARDRAIEDFAAATLDRQRRRVRRKGRGLAELDSEARHEVRIEAKKLRYAAEFFSGLVEGRKGRGRARLFLSALEDLQDRLGGLNDVAVGHAVAVATAERDDAEPSSDPHAQRYLFAAGRISERQDERIASLLEEAATAHRAFADAKPFWRW